MEIPRPTFKLPTSMLFVVWLVLLQLCGVCLAEDDDESSSPEATITTAPIFLPAYSKDGWSMLRGSIIDVNETASETAYTIFCDPKTTPACGLALEFPFIIVAGPETVMFHGTVTSALTANLECELANTTAATCSGYTSFKSGYSNGYSDGGPTETSWTSTLTGSDVQWGALTMAPVPTETTKPLGMTLTNSGAYETYTGDEDFGPYPGNDGAGANLRLDKRWAALTLVASLIVAGVLV